MGVSPATFRAPQALPSQPEPDARASRAAVTRFVERYGHRISATAGAPAGACSTVPVWWSRTGWVALVKSMAAANTGVCREFHVSWGSVVVVARAMAGYADSETGRGCRPTNDRLTAAAQCSERTVRRARQVLTRLRLIHLVQPGRTCMTLTQRLAAWRRGSSHRSLAAEFALSVPRGAARPAGYPHSGRRAVERGRPPGRGVGNVVPSRIRVVPGGEGPEGKDRRSAPGPIGRGSGRPGTVSVATARARRLIAGVQSRAGWLSRVSPRRLTSLHRFAAHGWTERDVIEAIDEVLRVRGFTLPATISNPPAYLAWLLRELDPGQVPHVLAEMERDAELARRARLDARRNAPACVHGTPGGDQVGAAGVALCPWCRRSSAGGAGGFDGDDDLVDAGPGNAEGSGDGSGGEAVHVDRGDDAFVEPAAGGVQGRGGVAVGGGELGEFGPRLVG